MGSVKDMPIKNPPMGIHPLFKSTFDQVFPEPKNDTRSEDHQEGRQKEKKRRDDDG